MAPSSFASAAAGNNAPNTPTRTESGGEWYVAMISRMVAPRCGLQRGQGASGLVRSLV